MVKANTFWGYSIKFPGQTASQETLPLPSPTSVLGALASSYARYFRKPETAILEKNKRASTSAELLAKRIVLYATSGLMDPIGAKHSDITRNIILPYQRRKGTRYHFAAHSMSRIYAPSNRSDLVLVYVVNDQYAELIKRLSWGIVAIGSKESVVSVSNVSLIDPIELKKGSRGQTVDTYFMTPSTLARCVRSCLEIEACQLREESYYSGEECPKIRYLIPINASLREFYGGSMRIELIEESLLIDLQIYNSRKTILIVPKEVIR